MNWNNEIVFITGISGSFSTAFTKRLLDLGVKRIVGVSRNEKLQSEFKQKFNTDKIKMYIGDICDKDLMEKIIRVEQPTIICLAAAMKHINFCEENPRTCIDINVTANINLIDIAIKYKVPRVIFLSTDKATNPSTIYGTSKFILEQYINCVDNEDTVLLKSRYGNVIGSNGSVVHIFSSLAKQKKPLTVTNPNMTRFFMSLDQAVDLVLYALEHGQHKDLFVYNNKACTIKEIADYFSNDQIIIGNRCEEKTDEALLTINELNHSELDGNYYLIRDTIDNKGHTQPLTSDNCERLTEYEIEKMLNPF